MQLLGEDDDDIVVNRDVQGMEKSDKENESPIEEIIKKYWWWWDDDHHDDK